MAVRASLLERSINKVPNNSAIKPIPGNLLTESLAIKLGENNDIMIGVSNQLEWLQIIVLGLSYDGFQSGPRYFL